MKLAWKISKTPKEWRKKHKLTQSEMADILGISRVAYNSLEQGKSVPKFETMIILSHIANCEKDEEKYGDFKVYSTFKIGDLYEVEIEKE